MVFYSELTKCLQARLAHRRFQAHKARFRWLAFLANPLQDICSAATEAAQLKGQCTHTQTQNGMETVWRAATSA